MGFVDSMEKKENIQSHLLVTGIIRIPRKERFILKSRQY